MREPESAPTIRQRVKRAARTLEPEADVILYGSRSRGDATPDSDWDFLILVDGPTNDPREDALRHRIYEIEWETGEVLSTLIMDRQSWNSPRYRSTPLHRAVARDGILL